MKITQLKFGNSWKVIAGTKRSQAAIMVIPPGDSEGGPDNKHNADQWLHVISGEGIAIINGKRNSLRDGTLLLIERGEKHEIRNTGKRPLQTVNFYSPPAY